MKQRAVAKKAPDGSVQSRAGVPADWHKGGDPAPSNVANIVSALWMITLLPAFAAAVYLGFLMLEMPVFLRCPPPPPPPPPHPRPDCFPACKNPPPMVVHVHTWHLAAV